MTGLRCRMKPVAADPGEQNQAVTWGLIGSSQRRPRAILHGDQTWWPAAGLRALWPLEGAVPSAYLGRWPSDQDLGEADHIHTHTRTCRTCPHGLVNTRVPQDTRVCTHAHRVHAHTCSQGRVHRTRVLRGTRAHTRTHSNAHTCPRTCVCTYTRHRTHVCTHRVHEHTCTHGFYTGHVCHRTQCLDTCTHSMCTHVAQDTYVCTHAHGVHAHTCSHGLVHRTHVPQETRTCTCVHTAMHTHDQTKGNVPASSSVTLVRCGPRAVGKDACMVLCCHRRHFVGQQIPGTYSSV